MIVQLVRMDPSSLPLFDLAERRLAWTDQRQEVLAQNIANVNTPDWQAKDCTPLRRGLEQLLAGVSLARTDTGHIWPERRTAARSRC